MSAHIHSVEAEGGRRWRERAAAALPQGRGRGWSWMAVLRMPSLTIQLVYYELV